MLKYLISPMKLAGLLLLLSGLFIALYFHDHLLGIGPYVSILGVLLMLTDILSESTGRKMRKSRTLEVGLAALVTAVVLTVILDITGIINLFGLLRV
jgi:hypothetical protein